MREYFLRLSTMLFSISIFVIVPGLAFYIGVNYPEYRYAIIPWLILILSETLPMLYILLKLAKNSISVKKVKNIVLNVILITLTGNLIMFKFAQNEVLIIIHTVYIVGLFMIYSDIKKIEKILNKK